MKKMNKLLPLFGSLLAIACSNEPAADPDMAIERIPSSISIRAKADQRWHAGDVISVFDIDLKKVNLSTVNENVFDASFSTSEWTGKTPLFATSCSSKSSMKCTEDGIMTVVVKTTQEMKETGVCSGDGTASVGVVTGTPGSYSAKMDNITAFIRIDIQSSIIAKVVASAPGKEVMCGTVNVDYSKFLLGDKGFWTPTAGEKTYSTVSIIPSPKGSAISGESLFKEGTFLMGILPGTYSKGFEFKVYDDDGSLILKTELAKDGITVERNGELEIVLKVDSSAEYSGVSSETVTTGEGVDLD